MLTTPRDLARIGQCMLDGGLHDGRQVLPAEWVCRCVEPSERRADYDLLWWLYPETGAFAAQGYLGTDVHVFPGRALVVVRMQEKPDREGSPEAEYRRGLHALVPRHVPTDG